MSVAAMLTAVVELVGDVLVNDAAQPVPRVLRYHGRSVPDDIDCDQTGILSAWWTSIMPSVAGQSCTGPPKVAITVRWARCWKLAKIDPGGIELADDTWDADAATLADCAEIVARTLMTVVCPDAVTGFKGAVRAMVPGDSFRLLGTDPWGPSGGVAGVVWRLETGLRPSTS